MNRIILLIISLVIFIGCGQTSGTDTSQSSALELCGATSSCARSLAWDPVTSMTNGDPLSEVVHYRVYYGTSSGNYSNFVDAGANTSVRVGGLSSGTYYFMATAYLATSRLESLPSSEVSEVVAPFLKANSLWASPEISEIIP